VRLRVSAASGHRIVAGAGFGLGGPRTFEAARLFAVVEDFSVEALRREESDAVVCREA
jgi:hypothetical protein